MTRDTACPRCGQPVQAGEMYCSYCGGDVSAEQGGAATRRLTPISTTVAQQTELMAQLRSAALGEYEILAELGRGGMASVYLAHDIQLDRKVAVKVMLPQLLEGEGMAERFKLEARTAAGLSHPHIIPIYAVRDTDHLVYFVMKFVEGRPLDTMLREIGKAPLPMVRSIISKVGDALGYAHRRGVVHRDIKPANLMIDTDGQPVVTDFGIAKVAASAGLTLTGATVGTPAYMSPEQASSKEITGASDQYSLGVVAYQMLTGHLPFQAESLVSLMYMHCHEPATPFLHERSDCPPELHDAVMRMLEKRPEDRFPDVESAVEAIGRVTLAFNDPVQTQLVNLATRGGNRHIVEGVRTPRSPIVTRTKRTAPIEANSQSRPAQQSQPTIIVQSSVAPWVVTGLVIVLAAGGLYLYTQDRALGAPGAGVPGGAIATGPEGVAGPNVVGAPPATDAPTPAASAPAAQPEGRTVTPSPMRGPGESRAEGSPPPAATTRVPPVPAQPTGTAREAGASSPSRTTTSTPVRVAILRLSPSSGTLEVGGSLRLRPEILGDDGQPHAATVTWSSSAPNVATVIDGVVSALEPGTATLTARADGIDATAVVRVTAPAVPASPPPVAPDANEQVRALIEAYERALESRQVSALRRIWPSMQPEEEERLAGALRFMEQLDVSLSIRTMEIRGTTATATVSGQYDFYRSDNRRRERLPVNIAITLEQGAGGWVIRQIRDVR